jgi:Ca2+-binding EF-hand superfamily protein
MFSRLDKDGSGGISKEELSAMGGFGDRLMSGDANGDGQIDQSELETKINELRAARESQSGAAGGGQ